MIRLHLSSPYNTHLMWVESHKSMSSVVGESELHRIEGLVRLDSIEPGVDVDLTRDRGLVVTRSESVSLARVPGVGIGSDVVGIQIRVRSRLLVLIDPKLYLLTT